MKIKQIHCWILSISLILSSTPCKGEEFQPEGVTKAQITFVNYTNCETLDEALVKDATLNLYHTDSTWSPSEFDLYNSICISTNEPKVEYLKNGPNYFEITKDGNKILKGVFKVPTDIDSTGNIKLSLVRKRGDVIGDLSRDPAVEGAKVEHISTYNPDTVVNFSNEFGECCYLLEPGRYIVKVSHPDYKPYSTEPGFSVFRTGNDSYSNFFIYRK